MGNGWVRWQCKRGMRELDELLAAYLDTCYDDAADEQKSAFRQLLELPNPELIGYLLGSQSHSEPEIADVIETIRRRTRS